MNLVVAVQSLWQALFSALQLTGSENQSLRWQTQIFLDNKSLLVFFAISVPAELSKTVLGLQEEQNGDLSPYMLQMLP